MTPEQIDVCKSSWAKVVPIKEQAAELFYANLFEADPELESLFKGDMKEQGAKLMQMITTAVSMLNRLDELVPAVQALGRRHGTYGVKDEDYDTVGAALLKTLGMGLGESYTSEVEEAWTEAYGILAATMIAASKEDAAMA